MKFLVDNQLPPLLRNTCKSAVSIVNTFSMLAWLRLWILRSPATLRPKGASSLAKMKIFSISRPGRKSKSRLSGFNSEIAGQLLCWQPLIGSGTRLSPRSRLANKSLKFGKPEGPSSPTCRTLEPATQDEPTANPRRCRVQSARLLSDAGLTIALRDRG